MTQPTSLCPQCGCRLVNGYYCENECKPAAPSAGSLEAQCRCSQAGGNSGCPIHRPPARITYPNGIATADKNEVVEASRHILTNALQPEQREELREFHIAIDHDRTGLKHFAFNDPAPGLLHVIEKSYVDKHCISLFLHEQRMDNQAMKMSHHATEAIEKRQSKNTVLELERNKWECALEAERKAHELSGGQIASLIAENKKLRVEREEWKREYEEDLLNWERDCLDRDHLRRELASAKVTLCQWEDKCACMAIEHERDNKRLTAEIEKLRSSLETERTDCKRAEHDANCISLSLHESRMEALQTEIKYWQADSAAAWDKCEERRLENEELKGK